MAYKKQKYLYVLQIYIPNYWWGGVGYQYYTYLEADSNYKYTDSEHNREVLSHLEDIDVLPRWEELYIVKKKIKR